MVGFSFRWRLLFASVACVVACSTKPTWSQEVSSNSIGMKLVRIPAGEFMMGAEEDRSHTLSDFPYCDPKWLDGEAPRHPVRITKSFLMGQYEVTLGQFLTFYHDVHYKTDIERDPNPSWGYDPSGKKLVESMNFRPWAPGWKIEMDHPVIYVSWNDAMAFCEWLSKKEGKSYRLPTEAEWEYAARAGSNHRFFFGNDPEMLVQFANVADADRKQISGKATLAAFDDTGAKTEEKLPFPFLPRHDGYAWTAPVGKYQPNAFGLHDMLGNAWEWCADWYDTQYYERSPIDDPQGPSSGTVRVIRGGGFYCSAVDLRCALRVNDGPSRRYFYAGFRVVCEEDQPQQPRLSAGRGAKRQ